jgi:uncharacterized protein YcfL
MKILKRLVVLIISLSIVVGCSSQHVLKGDISTNKDVNINVEQSKGNEEIKKSAASIMSTFGMLLLFGGLLALGDKYGEKK